MTQRLSEQAVLFGSRASLVGIFTRPAVPPAAALPTLLVLNTGIIHRVGHHRMYVTLSRRLAAAGYPVLRFDLSGIGDSDPRRDNLSPLDSAMADIGEALDWLEQTSQARRIVLMGLCSGADHAVLYGHTDDRIEGLILLDPSIPPTLRHYLHFVAPRLIRLHSWIDVMTGRSRTFRMWINQALRAVLPGRSPLHPTGLTLVQRGALERHYQSSVDKGIRMLAVFTEERTRQTYREQMIEALPNVRFGDRLELQFLAGSDHTFILEADRRRLMALILRWLKEKS
jgi:pimeloyl-ACP methyl ester carboxylesterase